MNYLDVVLLLNIALLSFALSPGWHMLLTARILLSMPITLLCLVICLKKIYNAIKYTAKVCSLPSKLKYLCRCFEGTLSATEINKQGINDRVGEEQPLVKPTSTVISYGAGNNA